jgi:hypothetical protein
MRWHEQNASQSADLADNVMPGSTFCQAPGIVGYPWFCMFVSSFLWGLNRDVMSHMHVPAGSEPEHRPWYA